MFLRSNFKKNTRIHNFFFDLIPEGFNIQEAPSKITIYAVNFPKENVFAVSDVEKNLRMTQKSKIKTRHSPQSSRNLISSEGSKVTRSP